MEEWQVGKVDDQLRKGIGQYWMLFGWMGVEIAARS